MKTTNNQNLLAAALTCALAATVTARADDTATTTTAPAAAPTIAAPATADADAWKFEVGLPLWAPGISGNATVFGRQENVNVSFNTLREHLDTSLGIALAAQKGKFGLFGDVGYMKFSASSTKTVGPDQVKASLGLKFLMANAGASYQLVKTESEHPFLLDGIVGLRYWYTDTRIALSAPGGPAVVEHSGVQDVYDPVLGFKGSQYLTQKLHLDFAGDGGGFNLNHSTDWTWNAQAALAYDFTKCVTLAAGYQATALDESNGGTGTNNKGVDVIFSGVTVDLTFKF
jgi:hypothetical protein